MYLEDANDVVGIAVTLGRAVPAGKWVEELVEQAALDSFKGLI
jgi:hypothetical protein